MKDKTKRTWLIVLGSLACVALVIVIAGQFCANAADPMQEKVIIPTTPQVSIETTTPSVQESSASKTSDPWRGRGQRRYGANDPGRPREAGSAGKSQ